MIPEAHLIYKSERDKLFLRQNCHNEYDYKLPSMKVIEATLHVTSLSSVNLSLFIHTSNTCS